MNSFLKVLPTLFICFPFFTQYGICSTSLQAHVIIFFFGTSQKQRWSYSCCMGPYNSCKDSVNLYINLDMDQKLYNCLYISNRSISWTHRFGILYSVPSLVVCVVLFIILVR